MTGPHSQEGKKKEMVHIKCTCINLFIIIFMANGYG